MLVVQGLELAVWLSLSISEVKQIYFANIYSAHFAVVYGSRNYN
jgi:hypothetical protein